MDGDKGCDLAWGSLALQFNVSSADAWGDSMDGLKSILETKALLETALSERPNPIVWPQPAKVVLNPAEAGKNLSEDGGRVEVMGELKIVEDDVDDDVTS